MIPMKTFHFHQEKTCGASIRLVAIADDLTGAFDTGVQFSKRGAKVRVVTGTSLTDDSLLADVLVIDAETRHLPPSAAYGETLRLARWAKERSVNRFYVKTDSGLRGSIGAALKAVMDATGTKLAAFVPAYPDMNRVTKDGCQWIDDVPLQESVFGQDLFDPVCASSVSALIEPSGLRVSKVARGAAFETDDDAPTVALFDAETNEDLRSIAAMLKQIDCLTVTSGCAAFAAVLPEVLSLPNTMAEAPAVLPPLLVICGSLNPITRRQMERGEVAGGKRITLTAPQLLEEDYLQSDSGQAWLEKLRDVLKRRQTLLIDTFEQQMTRSDYAQGNWERISAQMGRLLERLLSYREAEIYTPMIIGGDTLMGYLARCSSPELTLEGEVAAGVVAFGLKSAGRERRMLSKSGGFGSPTLFMDMLCEKEQAR
ncbi:MAG: four-carbon acid sugar kinase family protein [Clostridia bacterium]